MLSSLRRTVIQIRSFNGGGNLTYSSLHTQNPYSIIIRFSSSSPYQNNSISSSSFVVNYLITKCGLSEHEAITASKKLNFRTSTKPDSVLNLLENYGFTQQYISKTITKCPSILLFNPQKTLQPKFDFFNSKGLSGLDFVEFISSNTAILDRSLQDKIIPNCDILKNIVHTDQNVVTIIRRNSWLLMGSMIMKNLLHNVELLRDEGVPLSNISRFLVQQPRAFTIGTSKFEEIVQQIKGMSFDPSKIAFLEGVKGLTAMTKATWETKADAYRKWGWSEEENQNAFKKHPRCMMASEKKIMSTMDYLVNRMGYNPSLIAETPVIFCYSLEKRIIPRCVVIQFLVSKGHIRKQIPLSSLFVIPEKSFLEKFVSKYEAELPELLKVYHTSVLSTSYASSEMNML